MRNKLTYTLLTLLLLAAQWAVGQGYEIDKVCVGAERSYRIDGEDESTYAWKLGADPLNPNIDLPSTVDTVTITWDVPNITGPGRYYLINIQYGVNGCDTLQLGYIDVFELPDAYAGEDLTLCSPDPPLLLEDATATDYLELAWDNNGGDGTFDDATALNPTYTFGANDILAGSVTLTLTATGFGNEGSCPPATSSITITLNNLVAAIDLSPASCFEMADGAVTFTASGGTEPYTYNLDGDINDTGIFTGLAAGPYTYIITDAAGCEITDEIIITQPEVLAADDILTHNSCFGGSIGAIDLTITGGTGDYTVTWTGPDAYTGAGPNIDNLAAGEYTATILDENACELVVSYTITEPEEFLVVETLTHNGCFGGMEGAIALVITGGTEPYGVSWVGPDGYTSNDQNITGLASGEYIGTITDANGCELEVSYTINESGEMLATATLTHNTCNGSAEGEIALEITGGLDPYTVDWTGPDAYTNTGINITGLAAGEYTATITDGNGCELEASFIIIEPDPLLATLDQANVNCYGASNGSISITDPTGGSGNYEYRINGDVWQTEPDFTGLLAGTYLVEIRDVDAPDCINELGVITITQPTELQADVFFTNETFPGAHDATIIITNPTGGSGNFEYSIDGTNWQTAMIFTGLAPDVYTVYMRDAAVPDCFVELGTITIGSNVGLTADVESFNVSCFGFDDGRITISNMSGAISGNYQYSINGGTNWYDDPFSFINLVPGNYVVMIRDFDVPANAVTLATITISEPAILAATVTFTNETLPGANDGTITVTLPTGGSGDYEYSIDGTIWQASGDFAGLTPGSYPVYIRDANAVDCFIMLTTVEILPAGALTATVDFTNVTCFGDNDGTITISDPLNGSGNYEYSIDGGTSWQLTGDYTGLIAGQYIVMLRDKDMPENEVMLGTYEITQPPAIIATATITDAACDQLIGKITIDASGGSGSFEYMLVDHSVWQSTNIFENLAPGTYDAMVRDVAGCEFTLTGIEVENIPGPNIISLDLTSTTYWLPNGSVEIVADGIAQPLVYSITAPDGTVVRTWQPSPLFTDMPAGEYVAWVMDANGCTDSEPFEILNEVEGDVTISAETVEYCMNIPVIVPVDGSNFIEISSFFIELEFDPAVLSFIALEQINPALASGTFSTSIVGNNILQIRFSIFDGSATVPNGENLFMINFNALNPGISELKWNLLSCEIFESAGHQVPDIYVEGMATINPAPMIFATGNGEYCEDDQLTLQAGPLNGEEATYTWTGPTGYIHHGEEWQLGALGMNDNGQFTVRAVNEFLCSDKDTVNVLVNPKPLISLGYADTVCFGQPLWLDPNSGVQYENYLWHDGTTNETMLATEPGLYWVSVMDTKGCSAADSVLLEICSIDIILPNAFTPNDDLLNDDFKPIIIGWEPGKYYMQVFNRWGELLFDTNDYTEGWDGTYKGQLVPPGMYSYIIVFEAPSYVTRLISSPVSGSVTVIR